MLRKGAIQKAQPLEGQFLSNLFLVKKKDGGIRPVIINIKNLNYFIPYHHFKTEQASSSAKRFITGRRLPVQAGTKGCIFLHSNKVKEIYPFPLERNSVGVPLHVLRSQSSSTYIHKTFENTHYSSEKNKYLIIFLNNMLLMGKTVEETKINRDTVVFLLQNLGFVINLKKSTPKT